MYLLPSQDDIRPSFPARIAVYTVLFGDYDDLEPPKFPDVDYICFTDQPDLVRTGWKIRCVAGISKHISEDERIRRARRFKILPHVALPEYQIWLWQDANLRLDKHPRELSADFLRNVDIATFEHPTRTCIYEEANVCIRIGKDVRTKILAQIQRYRSQGYPPNNGLVWSALVLRRNTHSVRAFNDAWWSELERGSRRDQLSFNYVAWKSGQRYCTLPHEETIIAKLHKHGAP